MPSRKTAPEPFKTGFIIYTGSTTVHTVLVHTFFLQSKSFCDQLLQFAFILKIHSNSLYLSLHPSHPLTSMSAVAQSTSTEITLRGSTEIVTEFFGYGINSILYQRGIYPPESFTRVQKYGLPMQVTSDDVSFFFIVVVVVVVVVVVFLLCFEFLSCSTFPLISSSSHDFLTSFLVFYFFPFFLFYLSLPLS